MATKKSPKIKHRANNGFLFGVTLKYDFNVGKRLEIFVNGGWLQVSPDIFRSFSGKRRIDNVAYLGIIYYLGRNKPYISKTKESKNDVG